MKRGVSLALGGSERHKDNQMERRKTHPAHAYLFGCPLTTQRPHCAVIVAHPNDEIVAAGGLISRLSNISVVHVTDGAPTDARDARTVGFADSEDYARARAAECISALELANVSSDNVHELGIGYYSATNALVQLSKQIARLVIRSSIEIVLTHPYDGGHPDHDATAFAVQAAGRLLELKGLKAPVIFEFALHPTKNGIGRVMDFLSWGRRELTILMLDAKTQELKRRMFSYCLTQKEVLISTRLSPERFRETPEYDFTSPPLPGKLHYEYFNSSLSGEQWRTLSSRALRQLFPPSHTGILQENIPYPL